MEFKRATIHVGVVAMDSDFYDVQGSVSQRLRSTLKIELSSRHAIAL